MASISRVSSGIPGLDYVIGSLFRGDNVVLQVDDIDAYRSFVIPFVMAAKEHGKRVVYIRFANHPPLLHETGPDTIYKLEPRLGFESFSTQVHNIIRQEGKDVCYVFDCLSDLLQAWATDLMIGNFFLITCPYLFELNTVAYFALLRGRHSFKTVARIRETTQVLLDVYSYDGRFCVQPIKAWNRYSPTMFLPHIQEGERFVPITSSVDATNLFAHLSTRSTMSPSRQLDYWDRIFIDAERLLGEDDEAAQGRKRELTDLLANILLGRERRIMSIARRYFTLDDLMEIKRRLIGTGFIGGKSVGMLLARNILRENTSWDWNTHLERHDSYFIGSDVYYAYIVENGWWRLLMTQKTRDGYFPAALELKEKMLTGKFPMEIKEQFQIMLEYFGQSPIIVRSSSLLEDAYGNAFAGKYESYFCANQGTPEERYEHFEEVVRRIYASTMNEDALTYRLQRGLDTKDEQMALLVQRVSGAHKQQYFFPDIAGVGLSYNPFVWKQGMDPRAGMIRLVLGLGTRAVNRVERDYPRIVALDNPTMKPHSAPPDYIRFSQHEVDTLNIEENRFHSVPLPEIVASCPGLPLSLFGFRDREAEEQLRALGNLPPPFWVLTFDDLLAKTPFPQLMHDLMKALEKVYDYPVDIEFTGNFNHDGELQVNLLQCRPFQTRGDVGVVVIPEGIDDRDVLLRQQGNFMGGSVSLPIARVIYISPPHYAALNLQAKYHIARIIGRINKAIGHREDVPTLIFGPGRWGTTTPAMGIPVTFSEISNFSVIAEIAYQEGSLIPDLSFGTHFFQDLVEMNTFYIAVYPEREGVVFNEGWFMEKRNLLAELSETDMDYDAVIQVYDVTQDNLRLMADVVTQRLICFSTPEM